MGTPVPGWTCAIEDTSVNGVPHKVVHWSGPQVSPAQTAADSAQFFTFGVTVPSPVNQTSYGANGSPAEGFFANGLVRTVAGTASPPPTPTPLPPPVVNASHGKIVFQSGRDGNNEIYLMNADGSNRIPLPFGRGGFALPFARVAPFDAAGTVQFKDGTTNIGTPVPVRGGIAVSRGIFLPPQVQQLSRDSPRY